MVQILVFITDNTHNLELTEIRTLKYLPAHWYTHLFLFYVTLFKLYYLKLVNLVVSDFTT